MTLSSTTAAWLSASGFTVKTPQLWQEALTHGSAGSSTGAPRDYQRLEFLGDRVLGLAIADVLYNSTSAAEGRLALRLNALVSKTTCAAIARNLGAPAHIVLGKQARDDGAMDSDNVLGDVMEALIGAHYIDNGGEAARALVLDLWRDHVETSKAQSKHPKSALQEWAAGSQHRPPKYEVIDRSGPDHRARFTVRVSVHNVGQSEAVAGSKQEAETAAAKKFMEEFG